MQRCSSVPGKAIVCPERLRPTSAVLALVARKTGCLNSFMSKVDSSKEELSWLRLVFAALLATDALIVIELVYNYRVADAVLLTSALFIVVVVTCLLVWTVRRAYKLLEQLEDA